MAVALVELLVARKETSMVRVMDETTVGWWVELKVVLWGGIVVEKKALWKVVV